jgi:hypothetical protein
VPFGPTERLWFIVPPGFEIDLMERTYVRPCVEKVNLFIEEGL